MAGSDFAELLVAEGLEFVVHGFELVIVDDVKLLYLYF
jgi:hypothetical protein